MGNVVIDPDEFLAHYGKKGMKWGVRKSEGGGGVKPGGGADKLHEYRKKKAANTTVGQSLMSNTGISGIDIIRAKGNVKKAVATKNLSNVARIERVQRGEGSVRDVLSVYGTTTLVDVYKSRR